MKYYLIAGEASGDLHGSNLLREIKKKDNDALFRCWGGDKMQMAGGKIIKHYRQLAFMGFAEVIANLPTILSNIKFCKKDIIQFKPDVLVLIDYPGFNLRIAKWAKKNGFKTVFYISPQVWAWKENRVKTIKRCIDKMIVILPFEKEFYNRWKYDVTYVGHPLLEAVDGFLNAPQPLTINSEAKNKKGIIALLPGSRKQEIAIKLPIMLSVTDKFKDYQFIIAKAPSIEDEFYSPFIGTQSNVSMIEDQTYPLLAVACAALVTSGTATLETALFGVPQVICYKGSNVSYQIAKRLISIKFIGLVNLIMDKEVVKELIQHELTTSNIEVELRKITEDQNTIKEIKKDYRELRNKLSQHGDASYNAAGIVIEIAKK